MNECKRFIIGLLFCVALIGVITGCSSNTSESKDGNNTTDDTLEVAINAQPPTLSPYETTATATADVAMQIFEPLVTYNSEFLPEPMLAESYEVKDNNKEIQFDLREDIKFHNGEEMTSEDVIASMERWLEYSSKAKAAFPDAEFEKEDDYTVTLKLDKPNQMALSVLSNTVQPAVIMPKESIENADEEGVKTKDLIGTGPFELEEWKQDQVIKLIKFEDYSPRTEESDGASGKKEALVDNVNLNIVTDPSTQVTGIQSGKYDLILEIPPDNYATLENEPDIDNYISQYGFNILVFNKKEGPFQDEKTRQAVNAALDIEEILNASFGGEEEFFKLNPSLMLEDQKDWYTESGKEYYNQNDLEKAKNLLEESDYDGEEIVMMTTKEYIDFYQSTLVIQEQLKEIGMNVKVEESDWSTVQENQQDPEAYDAFVTGFTISMDPTQYIFLDSKNEWAGWTEDQEIDDMLAEMRESESHEEAFQIYEELQEHVLNTVPAIRFGDKNELMSMRDNIQGFEYINQMFLFNVKKEE